MKKKNVSSYGHKFHIGNVNTQGSKLKFENNKVWNCVVPTLIKFDVREFKMNLCKPNFKYNKRIAMFPIGLNTKEKLELAAELTEKLRLLNVQMITPIPGDEMCKDNIIGMRNDGISCLQILELNNKLKSVGASTDEREHIIQGILWHDINSINKSLEDALVEASNKSLGVNKRISAPGETLKVLSHMATSYSDLIYISSQSLQNIDRLSRKHGCQLNTAFPFGKNGELTTPDITEIKELKNDTTTKKMII